MVGRVGGEGAEGKMERNGRSERIWRRIKRMDEDGRERERGQQK